MKHSFVLLVGSITCCGLAGQLSAQAIPQYNTAYPPAAQYVPAAQYMPRSQPLRQAPSYTYPTTAVAAAPAMFDPPTGNSIPTLPNPPQQPRATVPYPAQDAQPNSVPNGSQETLPNPGAYSTAPGSMAGVGPDWASDNCGDCANGCETPCEPTVGCAPCWGPRWYAGVGGLIFTRNKPRFSQLSFDDTDPVGQVLSTDTGLSQWDAGPQITLGWYMNQYSAWEFTYWGLYGNNQESTVYGAAIPGYLNTVFDFGPLNIGADNVNDLYDAAAAHRVRRDYDVNNFELNFVHGRSPWTPGCNWQVSYLAGLRYMRFAEDFQYASAHDVPIFGADPANEAYYNIDVRNNLWGFQLGGRADWYWTPRFSLYAATKFGIYGNYMTQHSHIYNANGTATVGPGNPLAGQAFDIASDKATTSFIGEIDVGMSWRFAHHWMATIGYRAIAISGLAYATDQIPPNFADTPGVTAIDSNADMILHGAYAGVGFGW